MGRKSREKRERHVMEAGTRDRAAVEAARTARLIADVQSVPKDFEKLLSVEEAQLAQMKCDLVAVEAQSLRKSGRVKEALALATAGERRTPKLCVEEALAAFALGEDDRVEAAIAHLPEAKAFFDPLLTALRGGNVRANAKAPDMAKKAITCGKALNALRKGDEKEAAKQWRALAQNPSPDFPTATIDLALAAESAPIGEAYPDFGNETPLIVKTLAAQTFGRRFPEGARTRFQPPDSNTFALMQLSTFGSAKFSDPGERRELAVVLTDLDLGVLDPKVRSAARVYKAHGFLPHSTDLALAEFEAALASGADILECLRGLVLAADLDGQTELAAKYALRLARKLANLPGHSELAIMAGIDAERRFARIPDQRYREAKELVIEQATRAEVLEGDIKRYTRMGDIAGTSNRQDKERILDEILAEAPDFEAAWHVKLELAEDDDAETRALLARRASDATQSKEIAELANRAEKRIKKTPGAIARAIAKAWETTTRSQSLSIPPELQKARERLDEQGRDAVDAAIVALMGAKGTLQGSELAMQAFQRKDQNWQLLVGVAFRSYPRLAVEILRNWPDGEVSGFDTLFSLAVRAGAKEAGASLLGSTAHRLPSASVKRHKKELRGGMERAVSGEFATAHSALHPEFCLLTATVDDDEEDDGYDDDDDDDDFSIDDVEFPEGLMEEIERTMPPKVRKLVDAMAQEFGMSREQVILRIGASAAGLPIGSLDLDRVDLPKLRRRS